MLKPKTFFSALCISIPLLSALLCNCAPYLNVKKIDFPDQQTFVSTNANGVEMVLSHDTIVGDYLSLVNNSTSDIFIGQTDVVLKLDCCEMVDGLCDWDQVIEFYHKLITSFGGSGAEAAIAKNDALKGKGFPFGKIQPNTTKGGYVKLGKVKDERPFGTYDEEKKLAALQSQGNEVSKFTLTAKITSNNGDFYLKVPLKIAYEK